ncbi:calcineurin-binding protein cabin-1-like [Notechis scutatus]|uniref:Calcineurin-binding protein cabin-1-like n=1 Tax=Notechis scutatus TaxID=8663 RepID=A0A6J1V5Z5_9SAUR|nr:calcineurin-binding protein cabin-1-like [Notechis scutatus]
MKTAAILPSSGLPPWQVELESAGQMGGPASSSKAELAADGHPLGRQVSKASSSSSRVKSRTLPSVPKLLIPSSVSKFPPEITVTPPTPTLLSPKGSISEETKQKLKSAILSAQSAANVKKESLCQPALEVVETSSQESSLESDSEEEEGEEEEEEEEEEDNDCMDI